MEESEKNIIKSRKSSGWRDEKRSLLKTPRSSISKKYSSVSSAPPSKSSKRRVSKSKLRVGEKQDENSFFSESEEENIDKNFSGFQYSLS
jgi:hypothetical protein